MGENSLWAEIQQLALSGTVSAEWLGMVTGTDGWKFLAEQYGDVRKVV